MSTCWVIYAFAICSLYSSLPMHTQFNLMLSLFLFTLEFDSKLNAFIVHWLLLSSSSIRSPDLVFVFGLFLPPLPFDLSCWRIYFHFCSCSSSFCFVFVSLCSVGVSHSDYLSVHFVRLSPLLSISHSALGTNFVVNSLFDFTTFDFLMASACRSFALSFESGRQMNELVWSFVVSISDPLLCVCVGVLITIWSDFDLIDVLSFSLFDSTILT